MKALRLTSAFLALCVAVTAVNYYLRLGWFGRYGRLAVSVAVVLTCVLLVNATRSRSP